MIDPSMLQTDNTIILCNYLCGGAVAGYQVLFMLDGEEYEITLCEDCYEVFRDKGPGAVLQ